MTTPTPPLLQPQTYHLNVVRLEHPTGPVELRPALDAEPALPRPNWFIFGTWNPFGRPNTLAENQRWHQSRGLPESSVARVDVAVYPADLRFVERGVPLRSCGLQVAQTWPERFGQPGFFRWSDGRARTSLLRAAGVRKVRLHDARHTTATLYLASGTPARVLMELLGHSQISLTLNTYAQVSEPAMRAPAEALESTVLVRGVR